MAVCFDFCLGLFINSTCVFSKCSPIGTSCIGQENQRGLESTSRPTNPLIHSSPAFFEGIDLMPEREPRVNFSKLWLDQIIR